MLLMKNWFFVLLSVKYSNEQPNYFPCLRVSFPESGVYSEKTKTRKTKEKKKITKRVRNLPKHTTVCGLAYSFMKTTRSRPLLLFVSCVYSAICVCLLRIHRLIHTKDWTIKFMIMIVVVTQTIQSTHTKKGWNMTTHNFDDTNEYKKKKKQKDTTTILMSCWYQVWVQWFADVCPLSTGIQNGKMWMRPSSF